jgi:uncharacterized membrane protein
LSGLLETISNALADYYVHIKFVHMLFAAIWAWSTAVGYSNYLVPIVRHWQRNPGDIDNARLRNWAMERFDDGAILEHIAFPMLIVTGLLLMLTGGWTPDSGWFAMKLVLVVLLFLPIEVLDIYLAHLGGNKKMLRETGQPEAYERAVHLHWWFLVISTPIVAVSITFTFYLAIVKPF